MKPSHQWQTRRHIAFRTGGVPAGPWDGDDRAEAFELQFTGGTVERAVLGLDVQQISETAADDPDLVHAVRCWLAARGRRRTALRTEGGRVIDAAQFTLADLGDAPGRTVRRVITLAPSNAELLNALDCFDKVIACEDSSDFPPAVADLERLGPDLGPDLNRVAVLAPDLVVSSLSVPGMERIVTGLRARGVPQVVLAPKTLDDVVRDIERVGERLGVPEATEQAVARFQAEREALLAAVTDHSVRVYLEWWPRPMFTPGADCYSRELIELAGGHNVFGDRPGSSVRVEPAELVAADPQVCFVSWCGVAENKLDPNNLIARPGLEELPAARAGRVYRLDEAFSGRPGPRMLEAARRMAAAIVESGVRKDHTRA